MLNADGAPGLVYGWRWSLPLSHVRPCSDLWQEGTSQRAPHNSRTERVGQAVCPAFLGTSLLHALRGPTAEMVPRPLQRCLTPPPPGFVGVMPGWVSLMLSCHCPRCPHMHPAGSGRRHQGAAVQGWPPPCSWGHLWWRAPGPALIPRWLPS